MQNSHYQRLYSGLAYAGTGIGLLHKAKYDQRNGLSALRELAQILINQINLDQPKTIDTIIPMPLHPKRLRQRGYHQTLILARYLGKHYNIPVNHQHCHLQNYLEPQSGLNRQERLMPARKQQIKDNFIIDHKKMKQWHRVLIVDDVFTTGTTVEGLAYHLKKAGVKRIDVCVSMRTHTPTSLQRLIKTA